MSQDSGSPSSEQDADLLLASPGSDASMNEDTIDKHCLVSDSFNFDNADLTLRAVEDAHHMQFRVHRLLLIDLEGGFKDIILVWEHYERDSAPFVKIPLSPTTLDMLLRFIYPVANPQVDSLSQWHECYSAAQRFNVQTALVALRAQFDALIEGAPLRALVVATNFGLDKETDKAAHHCLDIDLMTNVDRIAEFGDMPSMRLVPLFKMQNARDAIVRDWAANLKPIASDCTSCQRVHWSASYINMLRAEAENKDRISMHELLRFSLIAKALSHHPTDRCSQCPAPTEPEADHWCSQLIASLVSKVEKLSALAFGL